MKRSVPWVLVGLQFVLLAALVIVPRGALWPVGTVALVLAGALIAAGLLLAVLGVRGLGSALTASPVPKGGSSLVTSGVYSRIRHPIYTGLLTGGLGLVVIGASVCPARAAVGEGPLGGADARRRAPRLPGLRGPNGPVPARRRSAALTGPIPRSGPTPHRGRGIAVPKPYSGCFATEWDSA